MVGDPKLHGARTEPQPFGRYTLLRKLATGGMGEVFLGRLSGLEGFEKLLVIKKIRDELASDAEFVTRFQDEARTLVELQHGSIAQVFDSGDVGGVAFIALEFVDGKDLKSVLTRCQERGVRVPTAIALYVVLHVLEALAYAHRKRDEFDRDLNLIHRDISPPNILIAYEGEVKVIDFGLAKSILSLQRTAAGAFVGKFFYMPPEAARHQGLDRRADLYSLGVVLHEVLHGRHVLEGLGPGEIMARVVSPSYPRLQGSVPGVSGALDAVIQKALEPDPARRFATAEEMRTPLAACLAELAPGLGPEAVSTFMRSLFADDYANERKMLRALRDSAGMRRRSSDAIAAARPAERPRSPARPQTSPTEDGLGGLPPVGVASSTSPTLLPGALDAVADSTEREVGPSASRPSMARAATADADEYIPPESDEASPFAPTPLAAQPYADPSLAPTHFEPSQEDPRPTTAPMSVVSAGTLDAKGPPPPGSVSPTVQSMKRVVATRPPQAAALELQPKTSPNYDAPGDLATAPSPEAYPDPATQHEQPALPNSASERPVRPGPAGIGEDDDAPTAPGQRASVPPRFNPLWAAAVVLAIAAGALVAVALHYR